jgi:hypothetical protein
MGHAARTGAATRRLITLVAVAALAIGGAAVVGGAANGIVTPTITNLNSVNPLIAGQPTPGGNVGYDLQLTNTSRNTINHVTLGDTNGPTNTVVYFSSPDPAVTCTGLNTPTLNCTREQFTAGSTFDITVLFKTDAGATPGATLTNTFSGTYDPQTPNSTNNRRNDTFAATSSSTYAGAGVFLSQSLALPGETLSAGGSGQTSSLTMPGSFLNNLAFVGTSLQNLSGTPAAPPASCPTCLSFKTSIEMPKAPAFGTGGPFLDPSLTAKPFTWTINLPGSLLGHGFAPAGVWHQDDNGNTVKLAFCARDANQNPIPPTTAPGICLTSLTQSQPSQNIVATGIALSNGSYWIG